MGYKMPNVVKTIYLPFDYDWVIANTRDNITLKAFNEKYKKEYGVDILSLFSLRYDDNVKVKRIGFSSLYKLYAIDTSVVINEVTSAIRGINPISESDTNVVIIVLATGVGSDHGYGITLTAPSYESSLEDYIVGFYEL